MLLHFTPQAFRPKAYLMNSFVMAGLLTCSLFMAFPYYTDSGVENEQLIELTATGIVLELHQTSLLIPITRKPLDDESRVIYSLNYKKLFCWCV
jgi:hypothetical protein